MLILLNNKLLMTTALAFFFIVTPIFPQCNGDLLVIDVSGIHSEGSDHAEIANELLPNTSLFSVAIQGILNQDNKGRIEEFHYNYIANPNELEKSASEISDRIGNRTIVHIDINEELPNAGQLRFLFEKAIEKNALDVASGNLLKALFSEIYREITAPNGSRLAEQGIFAEKNRAYCFPIDLGTNWNAPLRSR